jgi:hypothetical protein
MWVSLFSIITCPPLPFPSVSFGHLEHMKRKSGWRGYCRDMRRSRGSGGRFWSVVNFSLSVLFLLLNLFFFSILLSLLDLLLFLICYSDIGLAVGSNLFVTWVVVVDSRACHRALFVFDSNLVVVSLLVNNSTSFIVYC